VAVVDLRLYQNTHFLLKARTTENHEERISILEKAKRYFPYNHFVFNELGKAYFEMGVSVLSDAEQRDKTFQKSLQNFRRSIQINPGYYQSHFYFAQALSYSHYFLPSKINFYDEYKKAARLTTFDTRAYFEVGKFLLTRWPELSEEDRHFTVGLFKNIRVDGDKLQPVLQIWALNVRDYAVMEEILPEKADVLREYAQFLGERGFSLEERHKTLAKAESLDFQTAKEMISAGQRELSSKNLDRALNRFRNSVHILENIKFYQNLTGENFIDFFEYQSYKKSVYLYLAKSLISKSGDVNEAGIYLKKYLKMEENAAEIADLELYLDSKNLLKAHMGQFFNELTSFYLKIFIDYRLNRYREIVREAKTFRETFINPPESLRKEGSRISQFIASSYQRLDFLYDAEQFFHLALDLGPDNLEALKGLHQNYLRLNKPEEVKKIEKRIEDLLSSKKMDFLNLTIAKGMEFKQNLFLQEKKTGLVLYFRDIPAGQEPLLAIRFNDQIAWEDYLQRKKLSFSVNPKEGVNTLQLQSLTQPVVLERMESFTDNVSLADEELGEEAAVQLSDNVISGQVSTKNKSQRTALAFINKIDFVVRRDSLAVRIWSYPFSAFNSFELSNPDRVVLDVSGVSDIRSQRSIQVGASGIKEIRLGMFKSDTARLVFYVEGKTPRYDVEKTREGLTVVFWPN
jgi:tetratricopeptide (TPR) repeat protein